MSTGKDHDAMMMMSHVSPLSVPRRELHDVFPRKLSQVESTNRAFRVIGHEPTSCVDHSRLFDEFETIGVKTPLTSFIECQLKGKRAQDPLELDFQLHNGQLGWNGRN